MAPAQPSAGRLPNLGEDPGMTASEERRLGERIARELYRDPDYLDDPVLFEYVDGIWRALLAAARQRGELPPELDERFAFDVLMGRDRVVNAFALPGGYLGLNSGLLALVASPDELAAVLGHELSHVTQRHIARLTSRQAQQTPWVIGAMILGALAAARSPNAAVAAITGGQAVAQQNALNFSRDMEREADRIGFGVMGQAGFDPQGAVSMFEKLLQASRLNDSGAFPYLRSHPLSTERIADMRARLGPSGQAATANPPVALRHAMVAARARFFTDVSLDAVQAWQLQAAAPGLASQPAAAQVATLYGASLALAHQRSFEAAQALAARLASLVQADPEALRLQRLLVADLALAAGQPQRVLESLTQPPSTGGSAAPRPETLLAAGAQSALGRPAEAMRLLRAWTSSHPRDAAAWQQLSAAHAALGQGAQAARADAESRFAQYDFTAAQDRLRAAQDLARKAQAAGNLDHVEASIIDARLRAVSALVREQAHEAR